jgi:hypothetical protein
MTESRTRIVPTRAWADRLVYEGVARTPTFDVEISVTMSRENFDILQRIVNSDQNFRLVPALLVDLLGRAKMGDHEPLIRHMVEGGNLTMDERRVLGMLARNELPASGKRIETEVRARDVARFVMVLKLLGGKRAAEIAAEKFEIDRSYVTKHQKAYGKQEESGACCVAVLLLAAGADNLSALKAMLWYANVSDEDISEATQRKRRVK